MKRLLTVFLALCLGLTVTSAFAAGKGQGQANKPATGQTSAQPGAPGQATKPGNGNGAGNTNRGTGAGTGTGNTTTRPGQTGTQPGMNNGACVGKKQPCGPANPSNPPNAPSGSSACQTATQAANGNALCLNPSSGACVYNHGMLVRSTTPAGAKQGNGRNCAQQAQMANGTPFTGTATTSGQAITMGSTSTARSNVGYSSTSRSSASYRGAASSASSSYRASVVPGAAREVNTVYSSAGRTVVYQLPSGQYQSVTYHGNGTYNYSAPSMSAAPQVMGSFAANTGAGGMAASSPSVLGSYAGSSSSPSTLGSFAGTSLPRTGGGRAPALPALPFLLGSGLLALGAVTRRFAYASR